jgi:signal transduction histidine kinase
MRVAKSVEDRTRELSALSNHLQALSEREKSELARKLHDELGGLLTAAKMDLSWLQSRLDGAAIQERLAQLGSVLDEAMDLKRRVVEELRPSLLDHFGLPTALRAYVELTCSKAGLGVDIRIEHACESMSKDTAIALFRVVQEGLSNIIRHAGARTVTLQLEGDVHNCVLILGDDGQGFDADDPQFHWSHGLMGMRQRAEALGGQLRVQSTVGRGTTVRVEVPMSHQ